MALETGTFISELTQTNPLGSDPKSQGDDHLRLIKKTILNTFPNFVGTTGVPKSISLSEDQINDAALKSAAATISGVWDFTTNFQIDGVDILTGAIPVSGTWDFTGDPTIDSIEIGFKTVPQNIQNGNYTLVLTDSGKHIFKSAGGAGETITIPANASVAFPTGTAVTFVNLGGGDLSIAITTDTLILAGTGTTGTRTLADTGMVTALKVSVATWVIAGSGLT